MTFSYSTTDVLGNRVKLVWNEEVDRDDGDYVGDSDYKGYWATEAINPTESDLSYSFSVEKIHGEVIVKDIDGDYQIESEELDNLIEALTLIRSMRTTMLEMIEETKK